MVKVVKQNRVVVLLAGRQAGKKAVVIKNFDEANKERKFQHVLVAGVERPPKRVTKNMKQKKIAKKIRIKPFVKYVNLNHLMPTRYTLNATDFELRELVKEEALKKPDTKEEIIKKLSEVYTNKYKGISQTESNDKHRDLRFLFKKLRF